MDLPSGNSDVYGLLTPDEMPAMEINLQSYLQIFISYLLYAFSFVVQNTNK